MIMILFFQCLIPYEIINWKCVCLWMPALHEIDLILEGIPHNCMDWHCWPGAQLCPTHRDISKPGLISYFGNYQFHTRLTDCPLKNMIKNFQATFSNVLHCIKIFEERPLIYVFVLLILMLNQHFITTFTKWYFVFTPKTPLTHITFKMNPQLQFKFTIEMMQLTHLVLEM